MTTYDLLRNCVARLKKVRFDAVLFDEYHTIKSASAKVSQAACELQSRRVFGLTGTLVQNDLKELWFLTHLIDPLAVGEQVRFFAIFVAVLVALGIIGLFIVIIFPVLLR